MDRRAYWASWIAVGAALFGHGVACAQTALFPTGALPSFETTAAPATMVGPPVWDGSIRAWNRSLWQAKEESDWLSVPVEQWPYYLVVRFKDADHLEVIDVRRGTQSPLLVPGNTEALFIHGHSASIAISWQFHDFNPTGTQRSTGLPLLGNINCSSKDESVNELSPCSSHFGVELKAFGLLPSHVHEFSRARVTQLISPVWSDADQLQRAQAEWDTLAAQTKETVAKLQAERSTRESRQQEQCTGRHLDTVEGAYQEAEKAAQDRADFCASEHLDLVSVSEDDRQACSGVDEFDSRAVGLDTACPGVLAQQSRERNFIAHGGAISLKVSPIAFACVAKRVCRQ